MKLSTNNANQMVLAQALLQGKTINGQIKDLQRKLKGIEDLTADLKSKFPLGGETIIVDNQTVATIGTPKTLNKLDRVKLASFLAQNGVTLESFEYQELSAPSWVWVRD